MTRPFPDPSGQPQGGPPSSAGPGPGGHPLQGGQPGAGWGEVAPQQQAGYGSTPPGWYPGPSGGPQWWDGRQWGPPAPPANDNSTTMGLFCHLGTLLAGFLVPLIILLTEGKKNRFVKHHATEALNWSITAAVVSLVGLVLYIVAFVIGFGGAATGSGGGFAVGAVIAVILIVVVVVALIGLSITSLVFTIMGAVKAGGGKYWRYPFAFRFVKGAASKEEVAALNGRVV